MTSSTRSRALLLRARRAGEPDRVRDDAPAHVRVERNEQVLENAERRVQTRVLEAATDPARGALVRKQRQDVLALEEHATRDRRDESRDRVEQRGLAGAVRPDEPDDLPRST